MTENQKDKSNQQSDGKSHQEQIQEGKKKEEINPNYPKANKKSEQGSKLDDNQNQPSNSTHAEKNDDPKQKGEKDSQKTEGHDAKVGDMNK